MEAALENTQIPHKFMCFIYTLKAFFKDEFKSGQSTYLIPLDHIIYTKRHIFPYIREDCGYVCPNDVPCGKHQFLNYVEMLWRAISWAVEEKKVYFILPILDLLRMVKLKDGMLNQLNLKT